jgi:HEPN domain-containing protein
MTLARVIVPIFEGVHCSVDVLTWTGQCFIGGIKCRVCTPSPVPAWIPPSLGALEPPLDEMYHKDPDWPADGWGMINSQRSVTIYAVGIEIQDRPPSSNDELLHFDEAVAHWRIVFHNWLTVIIKGPTAFEQRERGTIWTSEEQDRRLSYASYYAGEIWEPEPVTRWGWNHAFHHAADDNDAPLALKLLALATRDAARSDGRNAVIHAATAAECALTNGLIRHLESRQSQEETQARMARNRMLGQRLNLARELGLRVPNDVREALVEPRNAVLHSGRQITERDAWRAVRTASMIIDDFDPLPEHCQEPMHYDSELEE